MVTIVVGCQWGDEGKGKIVDALSGNADYVVRFHGGNNAGHTVINSFGTFPLHLIPAGIFNAKSKILITNGVVLDLEVLIGEIEMLKKALPDFSKRLFISPRCHVIMPYHKVLDRLYEEAKGKGKTGTTGRGIGPVYADKVSYNGIRLFDLGNTKLFKEKLEIALAIKNKIIVALGDKPLKFKEVFDGERKKYKKVEKFIHEPYPILQNAIGANKKILLEGAHGMFLDNDWGTYPFVTASNVVSGAACASAGIPPQAIKKVIGIVKAYTTRVGAGPFPTELFTRDGERLRGEGKEFGTTTGRPRRCGWLDIELVRFAAQINGFTTLAITKLDVLDSFKTIKICTGYRYRGHAISYTDTDAMGLFKVKPVYKIMKGWRKPLKHIKKYADLPKETKAYLEEVEKQVGVPISLVSVGPERSQTIKKL